MIRGRNLIMFCEVCVVQINKLTLSLYIYGHGANAGAAGVHSHTNEPVSFV